MKPVPILFDADGQAISPENVVKAIQGFPNSYKEATREIIQASPHLDTRGQAFVDCASRILSSFGMTRGGLFHRNGEDHLRLCWKAVGSTLLRINRSVLDSGLSRDRYLLELGEHEREQLISDIWVTTKQLLPFTMGDYSYGLVAASKILFSVLPEIVLPIDNAQWLRVFRTVDLGDVIRQMALDIHEWEAATGRKLNELDSSGRLTTLPSVYNVMAMDARPKQEKESGPGVDSE